MQTCQLGAERLCQECEDMVSEFFNRFSDLQATISALGYRIRQVFLFFFATPLFSSQKGLGQHATIQGKGTLTNLSCDWSTQFMKVILLGSHWSELVYSI